MTELTNIEEWERVRAASGERPTLVFKHSTACPISAAAFQEVQAYFSEAAKEDVQYSLVKVIESRSVSDRIAADLRVTHESPQAILVCDGKAVWHDSHWAITKEALSLVLDNPI